MLRTPPTQQIPLNPPFPTGELVIASYLLHQLPCPANKMCRMISSLFGMMTTRDLSFRAQREIFLTACNQVELNLKLKPIDAGLLSLLLDKLPDEFG